MPYDALNPTQSLSDLLFPLVPQADQDSSLWITNRDSHRCYPFDLCYSKCRFSTDRIKQGDLSFLMFIIFENRCYSFKSIMPVCIA